MKGLFAGLVLAVVSLAMLPGSILTFETLGLAFVLDLAVRIEYGSVRGRSLMHTGREKSVYPHENRGLVRIMPFIRTYFSAHLSESQPT